MTQTKDAPEHIHTRRLEKQVNQLTLQLQDYQSIKAQLAETQKREALASLAAGVAHDFNNILHCILGYTEMALASKALDSANRELLRQIVTIVGKGKDLAQRFLVFGSKTTRRQVELSLNTVVQEVEHLLMRTIPRNITMEHALQPDLLAIIGDMGQAEQVVMNLCINARDAMPQGGKLRLTTENIELTRTSPLHRRLDLAPGPYVHLSVADTGSGITKDLRKNIFKPFFTTKEKGQGTGLGLAIVSSIVQEHGGQIDCTSTPGSGTTFNLYFPAVTMHHTEEENHEDPIFADEVTQDESILLVEDDEAVLQLSKHFLESFGYSVFTAGSCEEGLEIYRQNRLDLVIMDVGMPGMEGGEFIKALHAIQPAVKLLAMSGYARSDQAVQALNLDEQLFLQKPFSLDELKNRVRLILDDSAPPRISAEP